MIDKSKIKTNSLTIFKNIISQEGVFALYKGFPIVALNTMPGHALYFLGNYKILH